MQFPHGVDLILENSVKYSPKGECIEISFEEKDNRQHVVITSLGPRIFDDETNFICEQGYREFPCMATDAGELL